MSKRRKRRPPGYDGLFSVSTRDGSITLVATVEEAVDYISVEGDSTDARPIDCRYYTDRTTFRYQYAVGEDLKEIEMYADHPLYNVHDWLAAGIGRRYVEVWSDGKETVVERMK